MKQPKSETDSPQVASGWRAIPYALKRPACLVCIAFVAISFCLYLPAADFAFLNYDDNDYITSNRHVQQGITAESLKWAFVSFDAANWHPLTWLSHMLDVELFGLSPRGPHLVNVLFHGLNAALLFIFLLVSTNHFWRSAVVASFFLVHPLNVESVAWVAERKNVLSTFFFLLTLLAYVRDAANGRQAPSVKVILLFALGLLAKPMLVTLPFVLVLLDIWPLNRICTTAGNEFRRELWKSFACKWPLFILVLLSCVVTIIAQGRSGAVASTESFSLFARVANAVHSYAAYLHKAFVPLNLSPFYPHPGNSLETYKIMSALVIIFALTARVLSKKNRYSYWVTGWFWYLGTLVPVIGIVQVGGQAMADRYAYVPLIGILILLTWSIADWASSSIRRSRLLKIITILMILSYADDTRKQQKHWKNSLALFDHALKVTVDNYIAHNNYGLALMERGHSTEAERHFREVLRIKPGHSEGTVNLANALVAQARYKEAVDLYEKVLARHKTATVHFNLGIAWSEHGDQLQALQHFDEALKLDPKNSEIHYKKALSFTYLGRLQEAIEEYGRALEIKPDYPDVFYNLGILAAQNHAPEEAITYYKQAIQLQPHFPEAYFNLGNVLSSQNRIPEAIECYELAVKQNPKHAGAFNNIGLLLTRVKKWEEAITQFQKSAEANPKFVEAFFNLGLAHSIIQQTNKAVAFYKQALKLDPKYEPAQRELSKLGITVP